MPTSRCLDGSLPWEKFLYLLYITCACIMIRSIVRVAEFVQGFEGYIILHEVFLDIFDAVPMAGVMMIFSIWYPSNFSSQAQKSIMEREMTDSNVELEFGNAEASTSEHWGLDIQIVCPRILNSWVIFGREGIVVGHVTDSKLRDFQGYWILHWLAFRSILQV